MAEVEHTIHVGVGEVAKEFALGGGLAWSRDEVFFGGFNEGQGLRLIEAPLAAARTRTYAPCATAACHAGAALACPARAGRYQGRPGGPGRRGGWAAERRGAARAHRGPARPTRRSWRRPISSAAPSECSPADRGGRRAWPAWKGRAARTACLLPPPRPPAASQPPSAICRLIRNDKQTSPSAWACAMGRSVRVEAPPAPTSRQPPPGAEKWAVRSFRSRNCSTE